MKHHTALKALVIIILTWGCQDSANKTTADAPSTHPLNENVGKRISLKTAEAWLENYQKKYDASSRKNSSDASTDLQNLNTLLSSGSDLVGLVFHYAIDEQDEPHIIIIPLDQTRVLWSETPGEVVDATTNKMLDRNTAHKWATNYENRYPDQVHSHFFGIKIFKEIQSITGFNKMEMKPALNEVMSSNYYFTFGARVDHQMEEPKANRLFMMMGQAVHQYVSSHIVK